MDKTIYTKIVDLREELRPVLTHKALDITQQKGRWLYDVDDLLVYITNACIVYFKEETER